MSRRKNRHRHNQTPGGGPAGAPASAVTTPPASTSATPTPAASTATPGPAPVVPPAPTTPATPPAPAASSPSPQVSSAEAKKKLLEDVQAFKVPDLAIPDDYVPRKDPVVTGSADCLPMEKPDFQVVFGGNAVVTEAIISMILALCAVVGLAWLILAGLGNKFEFLQDSSWLYSILFFVGWVFATSNHHHVWVRSDAQKGKLFTSNLPGSKDIVVYSQGFSLKPWWHSPYGATPDIDFQKAHPMVIEGEARTSDGILVSFKINAAIRRLRNHLAASLMFKEETVVALIKAVIINRVNQLCAKNSWETMSKHRKEANDWVSLIFKGEDEVTPFEQNHGWSVSPPQLDEIDPDAAGEKLVEMMTRTLKFAEITRQIQAGSPSMEPNDVLNGALRLMGIDPGATANKITIRAPDGVRTVMLDGNNDIGRIL